MFKRNNSSDGMRGEVDTLIGRTTRINGDVTFTGGFHLDGHVDRQCARRAWHDVGL